MVGEICIPNCAYRMFVNSTVAIESKPASIKGTSIAMRVPSTSTAADCAKIQTHLLSQYTRKDFDTPLPNLSGGRNEVGY